MQAKAARAIFTTEPSISLSVTEMVSSVLLRQVEAGGREMLVELDVDSRTMMA